MHAAELLPHQLMQIVADFFESQGIDYRVVGSVASMAYGEPRFTNDVDIVADIPLQKISTLCAAFPAPDYYLSETAAREAIMRRSQFNIIHPSSGLKVDVIVPADTEFARSERARIRRISSKGEYDAWFGSPEDVLLYKMIYYQLSGGASQKHLRDIAGIIKLQSELDRTYIAAWAAKLGLADEWAAVQERVNDPRP